MATRAAAVFGLGLCLACVRRSGELQAIPETFVFAEAEPGDAAGTAPVTWIGVDPGVWGDAGADEGGSELVPATVGGVPFLRAEGTPLLPRRTEVRARLRGEQAEVIVRQRFVSDRSGVVAASHDFALPEDSSILGLRVQVGARVMTAKVEARAEDVRVPKDAREVVDAGSDIFSTSIGLVSPGEEVEVELRYLQAIRHDGGEYTFMVPTSVGPRGAGARRSGGEIVIEVIAEASASISAWVTPGHRVEAGAVGDGLRVTLAGGDEIADRDFVLRYRGAGVGPSARLFIEPAGADGGHFMLIVEPPRLDVDALVGRRELIFVVDVERTLTRERLALAQATVLAVLAQARPVDTFNVLGFGARGSVFAAPRPVTADNLALALAAMAGRYAGFEGGDAPLARVSFGDAVAKDMDRHVLFLTAGHLGDDEAIVRTVQVLLARQERAGRRARVFGVGIGRAVDEQRVDAISRAGRGVSLYVREPADVAAAVRTFARLADAPVLTDIEVDWGGLAVSDLSPGTGGDLLASGPRVVLGRYRGEPPEALDLRGRLGARSFNVPVAVTRVSGSDAVLARTWARARIGELHLTRATTLDPQVEVSTRVAIRELGREHGLVTAYTAFVVVDPHARVSGVPGVLGRPEPEAWGGRGGALDAITLGGSGRSRDSFAYEGHGPRANICTVSAVVIQEYIGYFPPPIERGPSVDVHAYARLGRITTSVDRGEGALRAALTGQLAGVGACFRIGQRAGYRFRQELTLVVRRREDGGFVDFGARAARQIDPDVAACVRRRIEPGLRAGLRAGASAEIELRVRMQF